jgi:hypothetical protein
MQSGQNPDALAQYRDKFVAQIADMVTLVRGDLKRLVRLCFCAHHPLSVP